MRQMRLQRYGWVAASALGVGMTAVVLPADPVAAGHSTRATSPARVGHALVTGAAHHQYQVCAYNDVHSVRGEFRLVGSGGTITRTRRGRGCTPVTSTGGYSIDYVRACDPQGCSGWKYSGF